MFTIREPIQSIGVIKSISVDTFCDVLKGFTLSLNVIFKKRNAIATEEITFNISLLELIRPSNCSYQRVNLIHYCATSHVEVPNDAESLLDITEDSSLSFYYASNRFNFSFKKGNTDFDFYVRDRMFLK